MFHIDLDGTQGHKQFNSFREFVFESQSMELSSWVVDFVDRRVTDVEHTILRMPWRELKHSAFTS